MIDDLSDPGSWARELEQRGSLRPDRPAPVSADERETLLETIRRLDARIMVLEGTVTRWQLTLEGVRSCSSCEMCRGAASLALLMR